MVIHEFFKLSIPKFKELNEKMFIFMERLQDTLLGSGSECPKDQALLLTMVSYLKK